MTGGRVIWEAKSREHMAQQLFIRDRILDLFRENLALSYEQCAESIGNWSCASTIQKWLSAQYKYNIYVERILPLLSKQQLKKHVIFQGILSTSGELVRSMTSFS